MSRSVEVRLRADVTQFSAAMIGASRTTKKVSGEVKAEWSAMSSAIRQNAAGIDKVGTGMLKAGAAVALGLGLSAKAAMSWESAFAGVRKTVDELDPAFAGLEGQLRGLARTMATSHEDIAAVAENAGALGVATKDIARFTRQMIILGETTNVTADEASTYMAQFMTIMGTAPEKVGNLSAALVDLGNNGASTEAQILEMSQRIAGAGRAVGLTEAQVMGFASAIASTGMNVEAGGSAISRVFTNLDRIVTQGGHKLQTLNELVGGDFATAFRQDASSAVVTFIEALGRLQDQGGSITSVLDDIGIKQIYQTDVIRRLAGAHGLLADQVGISERAMTEGTAALVEYGKRMETAESRAAVAWNNIKDAAIEFGGEMLPIIAESADGLADLMRTFQGLPGPVKAASVQIAGVTAAALLLGGGALKAVVVGVKLVDTFNKFSESAPRAAAGIKKAAAAAAILAVATVALRAYGRALEDTAEAHRTKWSTIATEMLGAFGDRKPVELDSMFRFEEGLLSKKVTWGLKNSLKRAFASGWSDSLGDSVNSMVFGTSIGDQIKTQFREIDQALAALASSGNGEAAAASFRQIADAATDASVPIEQVLPHFKAYRTELELLAEGLGLQGQIDEDEFIDWMGGKLPAAVQQAIAASDGMTDSLTDQQKALLGISDAADDAVKSMREYANLALALSGSKLGAQVAFDQSMEKGTYDSKTRQASGGIIRGGGFSEATKKGQHNLGLVHIQATAAAAYLDDLAAANASTVTLVAETDRLRGELVKAFTAGKMNREEAEATAAAWIAMPEDVSPTLSVPNALLTEKELKAVKQVLDEMPEEVDTEILVPGARPSKEEVQDFIGTLHDVPPDTLANIETIANLAGVDAAQEALDRLRDKEIKIRTVYTTPDGRKFQAADGGIFTTRHAGRLMRAYADGGTALPPIGPQQPRIEHNRGERGIQWSETGAGPWEGFVSGHPGKRRRSRAVTEDIADRLGGDIVWRAASGGVLAMPTYQGKPLSYWEDALLSPLELTRLRIRIRDLQNDLKATEKYGKGKRKKTRLKIRGLDREAAQLELADLQQQMSDARTASAANGTGSGTLAEQIARYEAAQEAANRAGQYTDQVRGRASGGIGSLESTWTTQSNTAGDIWHTQNPVTGATLADRKRGEADAVIALFGKLSALRDAGASQALIDEILALEPSEGVRAADMYLADRGSLARANQAYSDLGAWSSAVGNLVAAWPSSLGGAGGAASVQLADGALAKAFNGVTLTLLVDGKPIQAIVQAYSSAQAAAMQNATGGW